MATVPGPSGAASAVPGFQPAAASRRFEEDAKEPSRLVTPLMRLQDPTQTKMLIVTLPETTPVLEAAALQDDLRRAGIEPWAWVLNASLAAAGPSEPLLVARARSELALLDSVRRRHAQRLAMTPWLPQEPVGAVALRRLARPGEQLAPMWNAAS